MKRGARRRASRWWSALAASVWVLSAWRTVVADEIQVDGTILRGTVTQITPSTIEFDTDYGKGTIAVPYKNLQAIRSDGRFYIVHGDSGETSGRLVAFEDGKLLVGDDLSNAVAVDPATLHRAHSAESLDQRGLGPLRHRFALWRGNFDLGFGLTQSTTDTSSLTIGLGGDRRKKPTRMTLKSSYRNGTQKKTQQQRSTLENEIKASLRGEYDLTPRWFVFSSGDGEYDEIERLSFRGVPKGGVGYRFWETRSGLLQVETGGAYNYERFFGGETNDFFSVGFGKLIEWKLPVRDAEFV
jgi:hypothetical protein